MDFIKLVLILLSATSLTACSLYQSEGREFLEKEAFDFALQGASFQAIQAAPPCAEIVGLTDEFIDDHWQEVTSESTADIYVGELISSKAEYGTLLLAITNDETQVVCEFLYTTETEKLKKSHADIFDGVEKIDQLMKAN
ncbi:MAG: hypothetical protein HRT45_18010 [Bdellovibrionales bacterium]|nr:hypothetical protein [Bdellovibrionales bacterium]